MITMLLGSLWHGAGWTFILWGAQDGVYKIRDRATGAYGWTATMVGMNADLRSLRLQLHSAGLCLSQFMLIG